MTTRNSIEMQQTTNSANIYLFKVNKKQEILEINSRNNCSKHQKQVWNICKVNNKDTIRILTCEDVILVRRAGEGFVKFEPFPSAATGKCQPASFEIKGNTFVKRVKACFNLNLLGLVPKFWLLVQKISEHSKQNLRKNPNLVKRRLHCGCFARQLLELSEQLLCRRPLSSERSIDKAIFMRLIKQFLCD